MGRAKGFINDDEVLVLVNFESIAVYARTFFSFFQKIVFGALETSLKIAKFQFSEILTLFGVRQRVHKWWWSFRFSEFWIFSSICPDVFSFFPKNVLGALGTSLICTDVFFIFFFLLNMKIWNLFSGLTKFVWYFYAF